MRLNTDALQTIRELKGDEKVIIESPGKNVPYKTTFSELAKIINSESGGGSDYTETIVNISSAQILNMGSSPIELLPAPGVGKYYDWYAIVEYTHNSIPYNFTASAIVFGSFSTYAGCYVFSGLITSSYNSVVFPTNKVVGQEGSLGFSNGYQIPLNDSVTMFSWDGNNPTLGDGTMRVKIYHKTITFGE